MTVGFGDEVLDRTGLPRIEIRCGYPNLADVAFQDRPCRVVWADFLPRLRTARAKSNPTTTPGVAFLGTTVPSRPRRLVAVVSPHRVIALLRRDAAMCDGRDECG